MHPYLRKAVKWPAHIALYALAFVGFFVLIYHIMGYSTETDTHHISIDNESDAPLTDVAITVGHQSFSIHDIEASQSGHFTAVVDTEGAIGFTASLGGEEIHCSIGYITHSTYDFGSGGSNAIFWVAGNGEIRVSFGTPLMTMTTPQPCNSTRAEG